MRFCKPHATWSAALAPRRQMSSSVRFQWMYWKSEFASLNACRRGFLGFRKHRLNEFWNFQKHLVAIRTRLEFCTRDVYQTSDVACFLLKAWFMSDFGPNCIYVDRLMDPLEGFRVEATHSFSDPNHRSDFHFEGSGCLWRTLQKLTSLSTFGLYDS